MIKSVYKKDYKGPKYPTKSYGKVPAFHSLEEEADFWDTHNIIDYELLDQYKPKQESLILRVQKDMKRKLEKAAKKKGVSVSVLSRIWLAEKLRATP